MYFDVDTFTFKTGEYPSWFPQTKPPFYQKLTSPAGAEAYTGTVFYSEDGSINVCVKYNDGRLRRLLYDAKTGQTKEIWE